MAGGATELIIFAVVCAICLVIGFIARVTFFRGKGSPNWLPGQHYDIRLPDSQTIAARKRERYVDPMAKISPILIGAIIAVLIITVFAFYIITKGGLMMGN